jgi:sterol carrier protein 2
MSEKVLVAGVGMIPFQARREPELHRHGGRRRAPGTGTPASTTTWCSRRTGYVYGDSTCGQTALYEVGSRAFRSSTSTTTARPARPPLPGTPGGGSGARRMRAGTGFRADAGRRAEVALGRPAAHACPRCAHRQRPHGRRGRRAAGTAHLSAVPAASTCRNTARRWSTFAAIRAKASRHAAGNPLALFKNVVSTEDVMNDKVMWPGVMTRLMACPPTCGAAAA